ncbi:MAG: winged helix-turn-helix transcriptional regulator [Dethiobacter sp.]|jgi:DNA-binding transcriptional ArsR family regulator|nr:winged helix-turn-helix transcriptional regulator [Dethiobacter sp.]
MTDIQMLLRILGDETRFNIVKLLLNHNFCVGALASRLGISAPAVSQHLQLLRKAGLVKGEKRGYWTHYVVDREVLMQLADDLADLAAATATREQCRAGCPDVNILAEGGEKKMCKCTCQFPEKLKGKPEECSKEQIEECHGNEKEHPCKED